MASTQRDPNALELAVNGRLTEHTAHVDATNAPAVSYRSGGRTVTFRPRKLVIRYQWPWSAPEHGWRVLDVKATGTSGNQEVAMRFPRPETAPDWVQTAIALGAPPALTVCTLEPVA